MILTSLRANQLSPAACDWYIGSYLHAMDQLDIDRYATFLAEDVELSFNNDPAIKGKQSVADMLRRHWQSFKAIEHEPLNIYGADRAFMLEALNHYVRIDGDRVTTRAVALTDRDAAGLVTSARIFADASPVFEAS